MVEAQPRCVLMPTELDRRIVGPFNGCGPTRPRADTISFLAGVFPVLDRAGAFANERDFVRLMRLGLWRIRSE